MYRIFIVEDDEIIANLLKKNLCSWGYDVSCAEDFSNIIQEFAHRDPQLVLLDLKLPFYNGFHWCEEIRRISQVPIIFISSASDNMNMVMAMSRGADDFIAKRTPHSGDTSGTCRKSSLQRCHYDKALGK